MESPQKGASANGCRSDLYGPWMLKDRPSSRHLRPQFGCDLRWLLTLPDFCIDGNTTKQERVPWNALNRKRGSILSSTFPGTRHSRRTLAAETTHGARVTACELPLIQFAKATSLPRGHRPRTRRRPSQSRWLPMRMRPCGLVWIHERSVRQRKLRTHCRRRVVFETRAIPEVESGK